MTTKIPVMGRKKVSGEHKVPRTTVQIPVPWLAVARQLAAIKKQPVMWYILDLIAQQARDVDIELPPLPWEPADPDTKGK